MDTRATADLNLAAARFIERTLNTWECCYGCDPDNMLLDLLIARLHHGCVETVWSSSVQVHQADLQPNLATSEPIKLFPNCLAAIAHLTVGFTNADGSQTGASISKEATTLEADELECTTTSALRCALVQGHISACMHGISLYSGSRTEAVSWRCFMRILNLIILCAQKMDGDITLSDEDESLCTSLLQTLLPGLHQAAGNLEQRRAGRAACCVFLAIVACGDAYQRHIAALLLQSDYIPIFLSALQHGVGWATLALDLLLAISPYMTSGDFCLLSGSDGFHLIGQLLQPQVKFQGRHRKLDLIWIVATSCTDGDNLEKDSFTFGQTQDSHVTRQLGVIRAAATILGCIVDATEHSHGRGSPQESTSQTTGPLYSADQIEQHIEVSVLALMAIQYVQSVKTQIGSETHPAVEEAVGRVTPTLHNLLLKVLLPHLADPAANMTRVYHDGLPVLLACLRDSPAVEDKLDCLIEVLMDRMVTLNDFTLPEERTTSVRLLQAILFMVKGSPANQDNACVGRKPIILHMVWVLLAHEWVTDFMRASPGYLPELQNCLYHVWKAVCWPGPLELKFLMAACWLRAWKDNEVPDCRDALAANMVVLCLQSTYGLGNIRSHRGIAECLAAGCFMTAVAQLPHASAICVRIGFNLKRCLGFLDRIPSITHLANMRDVLVEGGVALLEVIPLPKDASLPAEAKESYLREAGGLRVCADLYLNYPVTRPTAPEVSTPELRPHRLIGTRAKSPVPTLAALVAFAIYCLELGSFKEDVQVFFKECFGSMVKTAGGIVAAAWEKLPAAGLGQTIACLHDGEQKWLTAFIRLMYNCHIQRWRQAKYRGPAPPCGFARASITIVIDMLLSVKRHDNVMTEIEMAMEGISRLYSHAAWQAQFREMLRSEQPDHLAIKAALHKLVMDVTSTKLLPDHVSKTIKACFLVSEVQEASANAAAAQLLAEEADTVKQAQSKKAKKERQKAKKQQQQQQQSVMQALQSEAAQNAVQGKPRELEEARGGDAVVQQAVKDLAGLEQGMQNPTHILVKAPKLECSDDEDGQIPAQPAAAGSVADASAMQPRFINPWHVPLNLFCCPLSKVIMQDPVIAADGHTYERQAMQQWLHHHCTSPVTGQQLSHLRLLPNIVIKSVIRTQQEW